MDGVILTPLKQIYNPRGDVFHAVKKSDNGYAGFGEAYFSTIDFGEIKGWKKHKKMTLNLIVPLGAIEFVIYDDRVPPNSKGNFNSVILSLENYQRLTISPGLWVAFKGKGQPLNLLLNVASIEHDPLEAMNVPLDNFGYNWS
jgi:dTDP-4-dehydrorhamnose 3,5-epimerase